MHSRRVIVVGGGAAGFFAAITCAEENPELEVILLEKSSHFLSKVRISGGGRCNVTHACFEPRELTEKYPRGEKTLIAPFHQFQASDTVAWFEARGVKLKTERDGRMFPITDSSQTIIDCFLNAARSAKVQLLCNHGVEKIERQTDDTFLLTLAQGKTMTCDRLLLATGGCRSTAAGQLAVSMGHTLEPPAPSLFTFHINQSWLHELAGLSLEKVEATVPNTKLREHGALLITHWGLSGPAILRLSAWGARLLHEKNYHFPLQINWLPHLTQETLSKEFQIRREQQSARFVINTPISPLPSRLWEKLVIASGIEREKRWGELSKISQHQLLQQLICTEFSVSGKSLNKDEFVTCGGVRLNEVNFKTMESKICTGLYFAGELLDIDGITGGFNFQSAWTTGWLAGKAMAK